MDVEGEASGEVAGGSGATAVETRTGVDLMGITGQAIMAVIPCVSYVRELLQDMFHYVSMFKCVHT